MTQPLVSIIIPAYNAASYIEETVSSALGSSYPNLEIIIVNDGSIDHSDDIIAKIIEQHPEIKYLKQPNSGASVARNTGIAISSGKYILPLDADDLIDKEYISKAIDVLEKREDVKIVYGKAIKFGEKNEDWKLPKFNLRLFARKNIIYVSGIYRRKDYDLAGGYSSSFKGREDWDFWISLLKRGGKVHYIPEPCFYYRIRTGSKRTTTKHLKHDIIDQLNLRHKSFFYKQLGGPLRHNRTWSRLINTLRKFVYLENIFVNPNQQEHEERVYLLPEHNPTTCSSGRLFSTFQANNIGFEVVKSTECGYRLKSFARKTFESWEENQRIGYYEKYTLGFLKESYAIRLVENSDKPKASLIIAVYKNVPFLNAVLDSLSFQTETNFEIIIAEDGEDASMKAFIESYPFKHSWQHIQQKDEGWRKNQCLNKAIKSAKSDWLIFIDGDCVLHPNFVEMHIRLAEENAILAGKRVKLDEKSSKLLLDKKLTPFSIQKRLIRKLFFGKGKIQFIEDGIYINPDGFLGFIPKKRTLNHLKGCNMSFSKAAITSINGFDEDYQLPAVGEDADLTWRFEAAGYHHKSVRSMAVQYHLHHKEGWVNQDENLAKMFDKQSRNEYICKKGLKKLQ